MKDKKKKSLFNYVILLAVLIIPFMYSFFYLKAYWNPYGKGNLDNLPVAIVNEDEGKKGKELVNSLKEKNTLKLSVVDEDKASDGLTNQKYYAVITIPKDFTSSLESASSSKKKHPTITYSPNQKTNYLASQIIDKVVTTVEANLDNTANATIVAGLASSLEKVPSSLDTVVDGFSKLSDGTDKLVDGSKSVSDGTDTLANGYQEFHQGLEQVSEGSNTFTTNFNELNEGLNKLSVETSKLDELKMSAPILTTSIANLTLGSNNLTASLSAYVEGSKIISTYANSAANTIVSMLSNSCEGRERCLGDTTGDMTNLYKTSILLLTKNEKGLNSFETISYGSDAIVDGNNKINAGLNELNEKTVSLETLPSSIDALQTAINSAKIGSDKLKEGNDTLNQGVNKLLTNSATIKNGLLTLSSGSKTLNNGLITLDNSVKDAKKQIKGKKDVTEEEVSPLKNISKYSENVVKVDKKVVNEVPSYGTAFSPFFISIALWVGALMLYIILYFDKENRFEKLSIDNPNHLKRTFYYHLLGTMAGIILAFLLQILLDFEITSIPLYYFSIVLIANTFVALIEFLILNFKDVGKFIALILLVLQLAAAGGTFPIETVTKSFRFLHPLLPMTYTIGLLRESLMTIEGSLLSKNLIIVISICLVFVVLNLVKDLRYEKNRRTGK